MSEMAKYTNKYNGKSIAVQMVSLDEVSMVYIYVLTYLMLHIVLTSPFARMTLTL